MEKQRNKFVSDVLHIYSKPSIVVVIQTHLFSILLDLIFVASGIRQYSIPMLLFVCQVVSLFALLVYTSRNIKNPSHFLFEFDVIGLDGKVSVVELKHQAPCSEQQAQVRQLLRNRIVMWINTILYMNLLELVAYAVYPHVAWQIVLDVIMLLSHILFIWLFDRDYRHVEYDPATIV